MSMKHTKSILEYSKLFEFMFPLVYLVYRLLV